MRDTAQLQALRPKKIEIEEPSIPVTDEIGMVVNESIPMVEIDVLQKEKKAEKFSFMNLWRHGVVVITTAQLHLNKPEFRFCTGSNLAGGMSEIRDDEDL